MPRVQTQYQGRGEQPQAVQAQTIQPIQARFDPNDSGAFQLAKALGAIDTRAITHNLQLAAKDKEDEDKKAASAFANSLTVDELGKRIKDGKMLPSQSPAFIAHLQHLHGENSQASFERDTYSKVQSGELKFESQEDIDKYLTEGRNKMLEGQSKYAVAGFDKGYAPFREKITTANTKMMNEKATEAGVQQSTDKLANDVLKVTSPDFKGTPEDAAKTILGSYKLLTTTSLLRDDARKEALSGVLTSLASSGQKDIAAAILDQKLDNGVTVRAVLGEQKAAQLTIHADGKWKETQVQRVDVEVRPWRDSADKGELDVPKFNEWVTKNERFINSGTVHMITQANLAAQERAQRETQKLTVQYQSQESIQQATNHTKMAVDSGTYAWLPKQKVLSKTGEVQDFDAKEAATEYLLKDEATKALPFGKQVEKWNTNNLVNPEWQSIIRAGASNVASVGWTYDGKNLGQLNEQGKAAIDLFMRVDAVDPRAGETLAGGDYATLSLIKTGVELMNLPVEQAAALVNNATRSGITKEHYGSMAKGIASAVEEVTEPGFFDGTMVGGLVDRWRGNNRDANMTSVKADITKIADLMVRSGQVKDANVAVQEAVKYLSDPRITTVVNNTVYKNKDLPLAPKGESPGEWLGKFIKQVPATLASQSGIASKDVRLEPNAYGGFTAMTGGVPLKDADNNVVTYRKEDISRWIDTTVNTERIERTQERNFELFQQRLQKEMILSLPKHSLPGTGQAARQQALKTIGSRASFDQLVKDGHADKPFSELKKLYEQQNPPPKPWQPFN